MQIIVRACDVCGSRQNDLSEVKLTISLQRWVKNILNKTLNRLRLRSDCSITYPKSLNATNSHYDLCTNCRLILFEKVRNPQFVLDLQKALEIQARQEATQAQNIGILNNDRMGGVTITGMNIQTNNRTARPMANDDLIPAWEPIPTGRVRTNANTVAIDRNRDNE